MSTSQTKFTSSEIDLIQNEIETYTKKIEHEKINLRLTRERYEKQFSIYLTLQGKPVPFKTTEQKEKEKKERKEKKLQRRPLYESKPQLAKRELWKSNPNILHKELTKNELDLDKLTNEINNLMLENKDLKRQVEDLRKEKINASNLLETLKNKKDEIKNRINEVIISNKEALGKIKFTELEKVKEEEFDGKKEFENYRDNLEEKYHQIIEENIRREREHKKEILKKRNLLGSIAANVMPRKDEDENNDTRSEVEEYRLEDDDMYDRTPILDILIEKWKFYNKYKKQMLDRYMKNATSIKDALEKMIKYLGIDDYQELPLILEKMEDQISTIEIFLSQLTNTIDLLDDKKRLIEFRIQSLKFKIENNTTGKQTFQESKVGNIARLKAHISELKEDMNKKRQFFLKLQPESDDYLAFLDNTYISDFIPKKFSVIKELLYNESNVMDVISTVEDYQKLIEEFDKSSQNQNYDKDADILVNKDLDKLKQEMRFKLEHFKKDNHIGRDFYSTIRNDAKINTSFDDTIRKMADEIVKVVNQQTGLSSSPNRKKK